MTMSVAQMAYEMGYKAVETMVQVLDGETVDEFVDSGSDVVTPDNAQERLGTLKRSSTKKTAFRINADCAIMFTRKILSPDRQENAPTFCQSVMDKRKFQRSFLSFYFSIWWCPLLLPKQDQGALLWNEVG